MYRLKCYTGNKKGRFSKNFAYNYIWRTILDYFGKHLYFSILIFTKNRALSLYEEGAQDFKKGILGH